MKKSLRAALCAALVAVMACGCLLTGCLPGTEPGYEIPAVDQPTATTTVVINEVMSANSIFWPAADGRCYDWVELRNLTGSTIDLSTCFITDDERTPRKSQLTGVVLEPYGYATIYLSGLNGTDIQGNLHTDFKLSSLGETLLLNDADGVVMSTLKMPESPENISYGYPAAATDFSESSCVWFSVPTPGKANDDAHCARNHADLVFETNGVVLSEYMSDNSFIIYDADGDYSDWVELYNPTDTDADMSGYMLTDNPESVGKWRFPDGTVIPAHSYMLIFCSRKNTTDAQGYLHTNFSLGDEDLSLVLSNPQGALVSQATLAVLPENISSGCPEGSTEWKLFARPTPGRANTTSAFELTSAPAPDINDGVLISETLASSTRSGDHSIDYIELYNATSGAVDLGGYTLAQSPGEVAFTFPAVTLDAGGYLLVFCDGSAASQPGDGKLHAPFKLNVGGENLYLANSEGRIVDFFRTGKQIYGVSAGRLGSDTSARCFFTTPTPGAANTGTWYSAYAPQPQFSVESGYAESGTQVFITVPEGCQVRYTTNGVEPDQNDKVYTDGTPITINSNTVVKAVAYKENCLPSQTAISTYLVTEPHDIAVVSLSGSGLTNEHTGILVDGVNGNNYRQGWVRDVSIEYFDKNGAPGVQFNASAEIFGQYSRSQPKKGLRLEIKEKYGASEVTYPFFPDSISGVSTFKSLLLRPSGQDQSRGMIRDEIVPAIIRGYVDVDYQEYQACALYVNGEYWGLYYIRERLDEDYIVSKYEDYTKGNIDLVKSQLSAQAGSMDNYIEMQTFARKNDLTVQANYEHMASLVDLESLCDFWIIETYFANTDTGNIRCYWAEGKKWRWMVYDFDWAMFSSTYKRDYIFRHCLDPEGHGSANFSNAIIRKLLDNDEFRDLFISRYCYHLNNTFDTKRCIDILEREAEVIRSEVPRNAVKWENPTMEAWEKSLEFLKKFFTNKPDMAKQQLMDNFGLSKKELEEYLKANK